MSWTDKPSGSRPNCSECGEHRWANAGYCLGPCAGAIDHPDYPLTAPEEFKWNRVQDKRSFTNKKSIVKFPPKGTRRALELQYESRGEVAPWLERDQNP